MAAYLKAQPYTAWQLVRLYWQSEHKIFAYTMLGAVFIMTLALVGIDAVFSTWLNYFFNAVQNYDQRGATDLIIIFLFIAAVYIIVGVYSYYIQQYLSLRWRRFLTDCFLTRWLEQRNYYYLEHNNGETDNPDQRIQEDIASLAVNTLNLAVSFLSSVATIPVFLYILWFLSGAMTLSLGSLGVWHIPGYLAWVGIIYAIVGTWVAFKIGYPLVPLTFAQQRLEANFRFGMIDVRAHAEHVALYQGEAQQRVQLDKSFGGVLKNWYDIILRQKLIVWFTLGYNQLAVFLPFVMIVPRYFAKLMTLGDLQQSMRAFSSLQGALSFFVLSYVPIAEWRAVLRRLLTFLNHMTEVAAAAARQNHFIYLENNQKKIKLVNVEINTPAGAQLLQHLNYEFVHGQHYLIKGDSGIGKSTLLRAIAKLWPYGSGEISYPKDQRLLFLPQRPYMPLGSLREALLFPYVKLSISNEALGELLTACDLSHLIPMLDQVTYWTAKLSPGELQRVAFIRVLLQKPDWVFLDESTSSMDIRREKLLYELLKTRLPNCSIISVGHRPSLDAFHDQVIDLGDVLL